MDEETRFRAAIPKSWEAAYAIASYLHRRGNLMVQIQPFVIRPTRNEYKDYGDSADILVCRYKTQNWKSVEVKWRNISFTSSSDFPYTSVFVDRCTKSDSFLPDVYYTVNREMSHAIMINSEIKKSWIGPNTYIDKIKGYPVTVYECPIELVKFVRI